MLNLLIVFISILLFSSCNRQTTTIINQVETIQETIIPKPTKILDNGLPNIHFIKVNFVPQAPRGDWDQPWQDACEEASILTVHYYYNQHPDNNNVIDNDLNKIFEFETSIDLSHDINISQMANVSSKLYGYKYKIIDSITVDEIKQYISQDIPVIITANGKTLFVENKNFKNSGPWYHSLVITGYDDTKNKFTVNDVGTRLGANFKYSYKILMDSIHDFPASGVKSDIDQGAKRVLILLK